MDIEKSVIEARVLLKERVGHFSHRACKEVVKEMYRRGYDIVAGAVAVDNYCFVGRKIMLPHYWNYDPETRRHFDVQGPD
jgi:hypothetical protein